MKPAFHAANQPAPSRFHRDADACALRNNCGTPCGKPRQRHDNGTRHD